MLHRISYWDLLPETEDCNNFHEKAHSDSLVWCSKLITHSKEDAFEVFFLSLFMAAWLWNFVQAKSRITKKILQIIKALIFACPLFLMFPFSWTPTVSTPATPRGIFLVFLLLLSLVRNVLLHAQITVATQELLLAMAIPPGLHLSSRESSTVEVHLGNVLNGWI